MNHSNFRMLENWLKFFSSCIAVFLPIPLILVSSSQLLITPYVCDEEVMANRCASSLTCCNSLGAAGCFRNHDGLFATWRKTSSNLLVTL